MVLKLGIEFMINLHPVRNLETNINIVTDLVFPEGSTAGHLSSQNMEVYKVQVSFQIS